MDPIFLGISVVNGIVVGGLYGAIAIGLSLIFGVMRVINFAHGSFLMVGLFIPYWLWQLFDQPLRVHAGGGPGPLRHTPSRLSIAPCSGAGHGLELSPP
jgi:branched-subunit amino acid ABC-type transport system permease component